MPAQRKPKIHYRVHGMDADLRAYLKGESCPSCDSYQYLETATGDDSYVDDEEMCITEFGPRFLPYKTWVCAGCGTEFRTYLAPVALRVTKEPDVFDAKDED